jgi:hypothetical protein
LGRGVAVELTEHALAVFLGTLSLALFFPLRAPYKKLMGKGKEKKNPTLSTDGC